MPSGWVPRLRVGQRVVRPLCVVAQTLCLGAWACFLPQGLRVTPQKNFPRGKTKFSKDSGKFEADCRSTLFFFWRLNTPPPRRGLGCPPHEAIAWKMERQRCGQLGGRGRGHRVGEECTQQQSRGEVGVGGWGAWEDPNAHRHTDHCPGPSDTHATQPLPLAVVNSPPPH